jgi:hypothetical protein
MGSANHACAGGRGGQIIVPYRLLLSNACYWPTDLYQLKPLPAGSIVMI